MSLHNPAQNALQALTGSTQFIQGQQDRGRALQATRDQQGLVNTQGKIAGALLQPGGRETAQDLAARSGSAQIIGDFQRQVAGLDQAARAQRLEGSEALAGLAFSLKNIPTVEGRIAALREPSARQFLIDSGLTEQQIDAFNPTDVNLDVQLSTLAGVQQALTTGLEATTLGPRDVQVQRGQETQFNPATQSILETERMGAQASLIGAQARGTAAQTGVQAEARQLQELENKLANGEPVSQTDIRALRGEFEDEFARPFEDAQDQFLAMIDAAAQGTGASDISLIFSFFKTIDPASTVRESEFATAAAAMGLPDRIVQSIDRIKDGEILSDRIRQDLIAAAETSIRQRETTVRNAMGRYTDLANSARINPQDVVRDPFRLEQRQQTQVDEAPLSPVEQARLNELERIDAQRGQ